MSEDVATFRTAPSVVEHGWLRTALIGVENTLRRDIDVIGAILGLVLMAPLFLVIGFLVAVDGGPVFFPHKRVGRNSRIFSCWKFRTMVVDAEECLQEYLHYNRKACLEWERDQKLESDPRVTMIGAILRRTSLDELPQLWDVLRGEMSLVGPRPVTETEMRTRYGHYASLVTTVRPGITGKWQVSGRNEVDYDTRVELDAEYVRTRNLFGDLLILVQTVPVVLRRTGAH
jgi:exopolysaccharide production protein ExoY